MKNFSFSKRVQAAVLSAVMTASAVPAYMMSSAFAVTAPSVGIVQNKGASEKWDDTVEQKHDFPAGYDASNPLTSIVLNIESEYATSFSYGFGITTKSGWMEHTSTGGWTLDGKKGGGYSVKLKKGENKVVIDLSDLELKYDDYSEFQIRCYYSAHYDNEVGDMVDNTVTFTGFTYNDDTPVEPSTGEDDPPEEQERENVIPNSNKHSNGANSENGKNWSFVDNGDGTATVSATIAKQIDAELLGKVVLTQGYDDEYYAAHPNDDPDRPMNSHKFRFSDFGLTDMDGVAIESITCTIEADGDLDQFVYGGGINVIEGSPADTEYAKQIAGIKGKETAGYWYNDMGTEGAGSVTEFEEQGVEFLITPGNGCKMFEAGNYIEAYWEVPAEVQPHVTTTSTDTMSFQYWYGSDSDGTLIESVNLTDAILTYTKTVTIPYVNSVSTAIGKVISHTGTDKQKNLEIDYTDLGVDETKDVYAIRFDVSAKSDIGKFIYNVGTGVEETVNPDYWFQEDGNYCVLEAGDSAELMWIVPKSVAGDERHPNGINTKDGKLLIGYYYGEADSITVDNIEIYYADAPETTTTTAKPTTTKTTTTTTKATTTTTEKATTTTVEEPATSATKAATTTVTEAATTVTTTVTTTETVPATTTEAPTEPPALSVTLWGDTNCDGIISVADATLLLQYLGNMDKYKISEQGALNADVYENGGGLSPKDALTILELEIGILKQEDLPIE